MDQSSQSMCRNHLFLYLNHTHFDQWINEIYQMYSYNEHMAKMNNVLMRNERQKTLLSHIY